MMDENEAVPDKPLDLERLSEDELETRIRLLENEIDACKSELVRKRSHRSAADALFKHN